MTTPASTQCSITHALARFAIQTNASDIPESARAIARLSLLDWVAVAWGGRDEPVCKIVRERAAADGGTTEATAIGLQQRVPARAAALVNATTSHALDYDDTHFCYLGHPSVAVFPAVLAIAEKYSVPSYHVLDAALIGMEATCRIGAWIGQNHHAQGFHATATIGSFGAAIGVARVMGLSEAETQMSIGLSATRASGVRAQFGTMAKPYHAGMAASNGVEAAELAAAGFVARADALECPQGFADTHRAEIDDPAPILDHLGRRFVFEAVQHKFHACCHGIHAAIETLRNLRQKRDVAVDEIVELTISVQPRYLDVCDIKAPKTGLEAKFSYGLTAAMTLNDMDTASLATYSDEACRDPQLVALAKRVKVVGDAGLSETEARTCVTLTDGTEFSAHYDIATPMTYAERETRVLAKARALLGDDHANACWAEINDLNRSASSFDLMRILAVALGPKTR